jgi:hypothetical protein
MAASRDRVGVLAAWGDRESELFYDIYSSRADVMRRCYRATHSYVYMVWDGRRWLQAVDGQWVGV